MITTKYGDQGFTKLNDVRISKSNLQISVLGSLDEAMAAIGFASSLNLLDYNALLTQIQNLYEVAAIVAGYDINLSRNFYNLEDLETTIQSVPYIHEFTHLYSNEYAAALNLARTVVRRAERSIVALLIDSPEEEDKIAILQYVNRLSDYLFALAEIRK